MHSHVNAKNREPAPLIASDVYEIVVKVTYPGKASKGLRQ